jgi:hypothetical protein
MEDQVKTVINITRCSIEAKRQMEDLCCSITFFNLIITIQLSPSRDPRT